MNFKFQTSNIKHLSFSYLCGMKKLLPLIFIFISFLTFAQGIDFFHGTWDELLAEAQKKRKPFFVDFYTTWCGPCKMMTNITFKSEKVGLYSNKYFIAYKVDCESPEGRPIAVKYRIGSYPSIGFYDYNGKLINMEIGFQPPDEFLEVLEGYADSKAMPEPVNEDYFAMRTAYFDSLDRITKNEKHVTDFYEKILVYGKQKKDFDFLDLKNKYEKINGDTFSHFLDLYFYLSSQNTDKYIQTVNILFEKNLLNADQMHLFSYRAIENRFQVEPVMLRWINEAVRKNQTVEILETKSALQYAYGNIEDAFETAKKAQKILKKEKRNQPSLNVLMDKIKLKL